MFWFLIFAIGWGIVFVLLGLLFNPLTRSKGDGYLRWLVETDKRSRRRSRKRKESDRVE